MGLAESAAPRACPDPGSEHTETSRGDLVEAPPQTRGVRGGSGPGVRTDGTYVSPATNRKRERGRDSTGRARPRRLGLGFGRASARRPRAHVAGRNGGRRGLLRRPLRLRITPRLPGIERRRVVSAAVTARGHALRAGIVVPAAARGRARAAAAVALGRAAAPLAPRTRNGTEGRAERHREGEQEEQDAHGKVPKGKHEYAFWGDNLKTTSPGRMRPVFPQRSGSGASAGKSLPARPGMEPRPRPRHTRHE